MNAQNDLGGAFTFPGTTITVNRMGYGAMQLSGPARDPRLKVSCPFLRKGEHISVISKFGALNPKSLGNRF